MKDFPHHRNIKDKLAVLAQENLIPAGLKVKELLSFFQEIAKDSLSDLEIDAFLQFTDVQKNQLADKLSGGQRRLLSFVLCLIGKPKLLFLDEPTAGMDTSTRQRFWEIVQDLKKSGLTIIYSSHYIEEVEHTADRILVLHQGKLLRDTTPFAMRSEEREKQFILPKTYLPIVQQLANVDCLDIKNDRLSFMTKEPDQIWQSLQAEGCQIADIEIQNKTLLNTLFDHTKEEDQ